MAASDIVLLPLKNPTKKRGLSVIVVPDFVKDGIAPDNTRDWLNSMMPPDIQAQILRFDYHISLTGPSVWHQLSEKGEDILRIFGRKVGTYQMLEMPLILIGYGLGGLIVKRALSILSDPAMSDSALQLLSKNILNMIAGVIFFGTPHTKIKQQDQWCRLTQLLQLSGKWPKRFLALSEADAKAAAVICEDFEQSGLEASVLSIYEKRPTRIKSTLWLRKDTALVDKELAETWAKKEKLLENDVSHEEVSTFQPRSSIQQEIGLLLMSALCMSRHNMTARSIQGLNSAQQVDLWEASISEVSINQNFPDDAMSRLTVSRRHDSSEDAILGSSLPSNFDIIPSNDIGEYVADESESSTWPCHLWEGFEEQSGFTGRDETFAEIDKCFFPPRSSSLTESPSKDQTLPCCCISGLGGMGKTRTAIQYGLARREQFDVIFIIQADNSAKLSEQFYKIAPALGLSDSSEKPSEEADLIVNRTKAIKWLAAPKFSASASGKRAKVLDQNPRELNWLLIFDNVENPSILRDYWPIGKVGCVLVTTRDDRTSKYFRSQNRPNTHLYLDGLDTASAAGLFLQLSYTDPSELNSTDAKVIVDKLGGLPLAIEQVAAYINTKNMTFKEFLALYDKTLLERRKSDLISHSWSYEIITTWALGSLSKSANSLIQIYSFLDPDGVQDSILTKMLANRKEVPLPQDCLEDELSYIDARGELLRNSLIRVNMSANPVIIRMHRLVQDLSLAALSTSQRIDISAFVILAIFEAWPFTDANWDHQAGNWAVQETLLLHIFRLADITAKYDLNGLELAIRRKFITLLSSGGWYRQERGDFDSGIPLFELGIKMCANSPNDFLDLRADLSFGLGGATCDTNRWSQFLVHAQEQLDYRLRFDKSRGIAPTSSTAIAYSELGIAQALMKQYEDGVGNCDKAIQLYTEQPEVLDGSFFPAFPHIHRSLALVGAGRPQDGERGLLDLIAWHEKRFGPKHTEFKLGYAWQCCGLIYAHTGRPNESIAAYNKAFANYEVTVGPLYHRTGNVCGKIAEHHESLNQYEAADFFFHKAEKAYSSQPHHKPELTRHYFIQAQAFKRRGEDEAAKTALERAQKLYKEIVPHNKPASLSLELLNGMVAPWVW